MNLVNVSGTFQVGEKIIASDSAETGGIIETNSNQDITIDDTPIQRIFEDARSVIMEDPDSGQDFTADMVLSRKGQDTDVFRNDGSDSNAADENDFFVLEEDASTRLGIEPKKVALLESPEKNISIEFL